MKEINKMNESQAGTGDSKLHHRRREILKWTPPVIMAVALPVHAECSPPEDCTTTTTTTLAPCNAVPVVSVTRIPKCKGIDLEAEAEVTLLSDSVPLEIVSISHNSPGSDSVSYSGGPTVTSSSGIVISWVGPGRDEDTGTECLPLNSTDVTVMYTCGEDPETKTYTFSLSQLLGG